MPDSTLKTAVIRLTGGECGGACRTRNRCNPREPNFRRLEKKWDFFRAPACQGSPTPAGSGSQSTGRKPGDMRVRMHAGVVSG